MPNIYLPMMKTFSYHEQLRIYEKQFQEKQEYDKFYLSREGRIAKADKSSSGFFPEYKLLSITSKETVDKIIAEHESFKVRMWIS